MIPSAGPPAEGAPPRAATAAYLAACAFAIGFALGYAAPGYANLPNLIYDPIARRFFVGTRPGAVPMGYYGQLLYALAGGLLAALPTFILARAWRSPPAQAVGLAAAWALTALALVAAWFTWNNWP